MMVNSRMWMLCLSALSPCPVDAKEGSGAIAYFSNGYRCE